MSIHKSVYLYGIYASYILYILTLFGIYKKAPEYLSHLNMIIRLYVGLFLIIRFNPYAQIKFSDFDRRIVFSTGIFLLLTTIITSVVITYLSPIVPGISKLPLPQNTIHTTNTINETNLMEPSNQNGEKKENMSERINRFKRYLNTKMQKRKSKSESSSHSHSRSNSKRNKRKCNTKSKYNDTMTPSLY
jgi:hypothetical protein